MADHGGIRSRAASLAGDWVRRFIDPGGLVPDALRQLVDDLPENTEQVVPSDKELMVVTTVELIVPDADRLGQLLDSAEPNITFNGQSGSSRSYTITRAYPRGHWNPISVLPGARQNIGTLTLDGNRVTVGANTLSFAAGHINKLLQLYGADLELGYVRYWSPNRRGRDTDLYAESSGD